jgi:hypothetical protein
VTDREARLAKNEALFRGVNERVREVKGELTDEGADRRIDFICECGRGDCVGQVRLTLAEYERVRADPTHFVVEPGHEAADVERIVHEGEGYVVVEKHEEEGDVARATNPRG